MRPRSSSLRPSSSRGPTGPRLRAKPTTPRRPPRARRGRRARGRRRKRPLSRMRVEVAGLLGRRIDRRLARVEIPDSQQEMCSNARVDLQSTNGGKLVVVRCEDAARARGSRGFREASGAIHPVQRLRVGDEIRAVGRRGRWRRNSLPRTRTFEKACPPRRPRASRGSARRRTTSSGERRPRAGSTSPVPDADDRPRSADARRGPAGRAALRGRREGPGGRRGCRTLPEPFRRVAWI